MKPSSDADPTGHRTLFYTACLLLSLGYALPALLYPWGRDQALHAYVGQAVLDGGLPYLDAMDNKGLGIYLVHAAAMALMGPWPGAIRVAELLALLVMATLVCRAAAPPARRHPGAALLLTVVPYYAFVDYWHSAQAEVWEGLFLLAAALAVLRGRGRAGWRWPALAGALAALGFLFKSPAAVGGLALGAWLVHAARAKGPTASRLRTRLCAAAGYLAGGAAVLLLAALPYAAAGELSLLWEVSVRHVLLMASDQMNRDDWFWSASEGGPLLYAVVLVGAAGAALAARRRDREALGRGLFLGSLYLAAAGSALVQGRFWPYHWVVTLPFGASLFLWGLGQLTRRRPALLSPVAAAAAALCFLLVDFVGSPRSYRAQHAGALTLARGHLTEAAYLGRFSGPDDFELTAALRLGAAVRRRAAPGDTLCVKDFEPQIYGPAGLRCVSRFAAPFLLKWDPGTWSEEYEAALRQTPPTFIVFQKGDWPRVSGVLMWRGYDQVQGDFGHFRLMTRRSERP